MHSILIYTVIIQMLFYTFEADSQDAPFSRSITLSTGITIQRSKNAEFFLRKICIGAIASCFYKVLIAVKCF